MPPTHVEPSTEIPSFLESRTIVFSRLTVFLDTISRGVARLTEGKGWALRCAGLAMMVSLFFCFPGYGSLGKRTSPCLEANDFRVAHPLSPIPAKLKDPQSYLGDEAGGADHNKAAEPRIIIPLLGWLSRTGPATWVVWNHIAGFCIFAMLAHLAFEAFGDRVTGAIFVLSCAVTFFGSWPFNDFTCGDAVAQAFLLLTLRFPAFLPSFLGLLAAALTDERSLFTIPLLVTVQVLRCKTGNISCSKWKMGALGLGLSLPVFVGIRWYMATRLGMHTGKSSLMLGDILRYHMTSGLPWTLVGIFKALWLFPLLGVAGLLANRRWKESFLICAGLGCAATPAFLVWDFDRSLTYAVPALIGSLYLFGRDSMLNRRFMSAILVVNMALTSPYKNVVRSLVMAGLSRLHLH